MPNWRAEARRAAKRHGLDPDIFERQIQQESGFQTRISSGAGAQGIAQIMPDTARGWGVDPNNPRQALDAAAKHMAGYVKQYGGIENALRAYNAGPGRIQASHGFAETNNYVKTIMGGKAGKAPRATRKASAGGSQAGSGTPGTTTTLYGQGADEEGQAKFAAVMQFLQRGDALDLATNFKAAEELDSPQDVKLHSPGTIDSPGPETDHAGGGHQPRLRGKDLSSLGHEIDSFARRLGAPSGSHERSVEHNAAVGGAKDSDHLPGSDRWAGDYPLRGEKRTAVARRMAKRLGVPFKPDGISQGTIKVGKHKYRVQVIEGPSVGHDDHVHVGFRQL